jgi:hypothetical protein
LHLTARIERLLQAILGLECLIFKRKLARVFIAYRLIFAVTGSVCEPGIILGEYPGKLGVHVVKKIHLATILIISALLLSAFSPAVPAQASAATTPPKLEITNKSGTNVYLTLKGPQSLYLTVLPGISKVELLKGTYQYSYWACGVQETGTVVIKTAGKLTISQCGTAGGSKKSPQLVIVNKNKTTVTVYVYGPTYHMVVAKPGKTKLPVSEGKYQYSFRTDCGGYQSGSLQVKKSGAQLLIPACKTDKAGKGEKTANVTIVNDTGGTMTLILSGPANYTFYLQPGKTKIDVTQGKYEYSAFGCGDSEYGSIRLRSGFKWNWYCSY